MRTLNAALQEAEDAIGKVDARVLVAHLLGVDRAYLATHPMRVLTETEDARVDFAVAQRSLGQPVAYLTEKREFYGRDFLVGPEVLIPRPETEHLVEAVLQRLPAGGSCLDLGTGSGAIAVSVACERPDAAVAAVERSLEALRLARANAEQCRPARAIEFLAGDWYAPVAGRRFDAIAANPPYVAGEDPHLGRGDLRFEPREALTDGSPDGLDSLRAIIQGAPAHLNSGGWLLLEHGYDQAAAVRSMLEAAGFTECRSIPDLAGIARVAEGHLHPNRSQP